MPKVQSYIKFVSAKCSQRAQNVSNCKYRARIKVAISLDLGPQIKNYFGRKGSHTYQKKISGELSV